MYVSVDMYVYISLTIPDIFSSRKLSLSDTKTGLESLFYAKLNYKINVKLSNERLLFFKFHH